MVDPTGTNTTPILPGIDLPALGGDLSSVAGTTTISVVKINGATLGTATATSGNVLIASGTAWNSQSLLGDITITAGGTTTVAAINAVALGATTATSGNVLIASGTSWVSKGLLGDITLTAGGTTTVAAIAGVAPGPAGTATIGQIPGIASATAAVAGNIGEFVISSLASGSARALSTNTATTVCSSVLTAGDWDVWGFGYVTVGATTVTTKVSLGVSTSSAALPNSTTGALGQLSLGTGGLTGGNDYGCPVGPSQVIIAATSTAYLLAQVTFATSTAGIYGTMQARRRR